MELASRMRWFWQSLSAIPIQDKMARETVAMETVAMETVAMETVAMEMVAMEMVAMETVAMETVAMETVAMETAVAAKFNGLTTVPGLPSSSLIKIKHLPTSYSGCHLSLQTTPRL